MKTSIASLLFLFFFLGTLTAQKEDSKQACLKVTSFSSSLGFGGATTSNTEQDYIYLKNAAENPDLFIDITGFENGSTSWNYNGIYYNNYGYYGSGGGNGNLLFNLGLTPYSKKKDQYRENRELRISIGGSLGTRNSFFYYDNNSFVIDTFQSVGGTGTVYADSVINKNYTYDLEFSEVSFGLSYLFKTDVSRRVHFYAGAGINYGITLRSSVNVTEDTWRSVYYYNEYDKPVDDETGYYGYYGNNGQYSYSSNSTNLKNPMQFVRIYIPMGISLSLSKKASSFFSHVDLYAELNPGVEFQILSPEKTYANPYFGMAFIGFRYHW